MGKKKKGKGKKGGKEECIAGQGTPISVLRTKEQGAYHPASPFQTPFGKTTDKKEKEEQRISLRGKSSGKRDTHTSPKRLYGTKAFDSKGLTWIDEKQKRKVWKKDITRGLFEWESQCYY